MNSTWNKSVFEILLIWFVVEIWSRWDKLCTLTICELNPKIHWCKNVIWTKWHNFDWTYVCLQTLQVAFFQFVFVKSNQAIFIQHISDMECNALFFTGKKIKIIIILCRLHPSTTLFRPHTSQNSSAQQVYLWTHSSNIKSAFSVTFSWTLLRVDGYWENHYFEIWKIPLLPVTERSSDVLKFSTRTGDGHSNSD